MQDDNGNTALVFRGLTSRLEGRGAARATGEDSISMVREVGTAFRRRSEDSPLREVVFAPDSEEQVGRKNGRNAVLPTGDQEVRRSGPAAAGKGCVLPGALGWGLVGRLGQLVEGLECQAKQVWLCFAGQALGRLLCACRTVELLHTMC